MYGSKERNVVNGSDVWLHKSKLITCWYCQGNRTKLVKKTTFLQLTPPSFLSANTEIMTTSFIVSSVLCDLVGAGRVLFVPHTHGTQGVQSKKKLFFI